jgi:4-carboxymuconolactone decarboxylase
MSASEAEVLLREIAEKRGYTLDMHRILAEADPGFLRSYEDLLDAAYIKSRSLDRRTKELIYIGVLTAVSAPRQQVVAHMEAAIAAGADAKEILEVLEQVLPPAGVPRFIEGLEAWAGIFGNGVTGRKGGPDG